MTSARPPGARPPRSDRPAAAAGPDDTRSHVAGSETTPSRAAWAVRGDLETAGAEGALPRPRFRVTPIVGELHRAGVARGARQPIDRGGNLAPPRPARVKLRAIRFRCQPGAIGPFWRFRGVDRLAHRRRHMVVQRDNRARKRRGLLGDLLGPGRRLFGSGRSRRMRPRR